MKPILIVLLLLMADLCNAQSPLRPGRYRLDRDKPLLRERDAPQTNSWLIRSERDGIISPAIVWPEEHKGMKDLMRQVWVKDSLRMAIPPRFDSLPIFDRIEFSRPLERMERELQRPADERQK